MPGGIGDTVSGGGLSVIAVIAIMALLGAIVVVVSHSSALRRLFDRFCGHDDIAAGVAGSSEGSETSSDDASQAPANAWPGFDPAFYGTPPAAQSNESDSPNPNRGP